MKHQDTHEQKKGAPCHPVEGHAHQHGPNCGHKAVKHGDHIDYEHDGHFCRMHGNHVDVCDGPKKADH